jgi:hypothetical protein
MCLCGRWGGWGRGQVQCCSSKKPPKTLYFCSHFTVNPPNIRCRTKLPECIQAGSCFWNLWFFVFSFKKMDSLHIVQLKGLFCSMQTKLQFSRVLKSDRLLLRRLAESSNDGIGESVKRTNKTESGWVALVSQIPKDGTGKPQTTVCSRSHWNIQYKRVET